ncbi:hypothetical protein F5876DRAFT_84489 [Lentinula aff. lateritia]|uniref:Uncharacterized protein n=1 Tax=Lentinula aff. lateritia TaxID=2804960 RepID=A0ACC1TGM6_9AGAR|nr:hypothetical protein F5876DRAFT_84489 [Lentinula aff. lateritia]
MRRMLQDIQIRLEQNFSLTPTQQKTIRAIVQDMLYDPLCTCYHDISADVFDELKKNAKQYHFNNIFNVPAYEKVLQKAIIRVSSSVRNGFHQHLHDGLAKGENAVEFTGHMNKIYLRPGGPAQNRELVLHRNIILRRFVHDNPNMVWLEEGDIDEGDNEYTASSGTKKRKLKPAATGRIAKGQDFWSLVDKWFVKKLEELGRKITDSKWKQLIEEYRRLDEAGFKEVPAQAPGSATCGPSPETLGTSGNGQSMQAASAGPCMNSMLYLQ